MYVIVIRGGKFVIHFIASISNFNISSYLVDFHVVIVNGGE